MKKLTYTYGAHGKALTSIGSVCNPFKYTGEHTDSEANEGPNIAIERHTGDKYIARGIEDALLAMDESSM